MLSDGNTLPGTDKSGKRGDELLVVKSQKAYKTPIP